MAGWNDHQKQIVARTLSDLKWLIANQRLEAYDEKRPYDRPKRRPSNPFVGDCTGTIKLVVCDWNGIPTFDGEPSGYGNTATFYNGPKVYHVPFRPSAWQPLDIMLYKRSWGPFRGGPGEHATILTHEENGVWHCFSMGGTPDPANVAWNYRPDHVAVIRFRIPRK